MRILSLAVNGHDCSATIIENGKVVFYLPAERITRRKHDDEFAELPRVFRDNGMLEYTDIVVNYFRHIVKSKKIGLADTLGGPCVVDIEEFLRRMGFKWKNLILDYEHHLHHAYCGFFNSPFDKALCIILDGGGAEKLDNGSFLEVESIYAADRKSITEVSKKYHNVVHIKHSSSLYHEKGGPIAIGDKFGKLAEFMGFTYFDGGKVMGLAQYKGYESEVGERWRPYIDKCYNVQKETEDEVIEIIRKYSQETGMNNIVLSGGYALNCVANYKFKKLFPHLNFYIDPICADVGISLGQSYYYYKKIYGRNIIPLKNAYIGTQSRYNLSTLMHKKTSYNEVAQLLSDGKVVALFQGRAEAGYRALGNRSLLMDPRISDGRDKLNKIKGREDFRPFAGTVLQEYANEWFDIEESEYMQYAAKVKKEGIPAMIHVDNTCRVQTVTKKQNKHFYNLIRSFYKLTDTPLLLNTSLNCAGETIAENFDQCISTSHRMKIPYIFLPEKMELVQLGK